MLTITSRHKISAAHRLYDYEGKCEHLHGHNYLVEITLTSDQLDNLGMIIDFSTVKACLWSELDKLWDHRTLLFDQDPLCQPLQDLLHDTSVCAVPFNPTAENMASYLGSHFFPKMLEANGFSQRIRILRITIFETENNSATWHSHEPASC